MPTFIGTGVIDETGGGRLVDDPLDGQPGEPPRLQRGLSLRLVEEGGHRDHGPAHRAAEGTLGTSLERLEDDAADFLRRVGRAGHGERHGLAHPPLHRGDRAVRKGGELVAGGLTHQHAAVGSDADDRRHQGRAAFLEHLHPPVDGDGDDAVGRPQINADHRRVVRHGLLLI